MGKQRRRLYDDKPRSKLQKVVWGRISEAVRLQGGIRELSCFDLLGCNVDEYKIYLESLFQHGMTWENHGIHGWHIDHIKDCFRFDLKDTEQQKECFHYTNTQPLWAKENWGKSRQ